MHTHIGRLVNFLFIHPTIRIVRNFTIKIAHKLSASQMCSSQMCSSQDVFIVSSYNIYSDKLICIILGIHLYIAGSWDKTPWVLLVCLGFATKAPTFTSNHLLGFLGSFLANPKRANIKG